MCVVIDANMCSKFKDKNNNDMAPVWDFVLQNKGKIAYAPLAEIEQEYHRAGMDDLMLQFKRNGDLKEVEATLVQAKKSEIITKVVSDDAHFVALSIVAKAKVLISTDTKLHKDFKKMVRGRVYQNHTHHNLLQKKMCP